MRKISNENIEGDVVLVEDGGFHRDYNTSQEDLYFVCVFDGKRNH